jgi:hypothetical protein
MRSPDRSEHDDDWQPVERTMRFLLVYTTVTTVLCAYLLWVVVALMSRP